MSLSNFEKLVQTVHRLRAPGGCPWDRAQTHQSLRPYLIEEAYEVLDVLDQVATPEDLKKHTPALREELGDLLMQVVLHSEMTREAGAFGIDDVVAALDDKLIRRHPHVFGEQKADSVETAFQTWEKQKAKEKAANPEASVLDGVPRGLPALQKAARVLEKVTKVGFQWEDMQGPLAKVEEELAEMKVEVQALEKIAKSDETAAAAQRKKLEAEMGDLFFTLCNVAFLMKVSPEDALRSTLARFESRFRHVERSLKKAGKLPEQSNLEEMDRYWNEAKGLEKK
jgi:tetrapyrrole methylase family protein/MazG family protein